MTSVSLNQISKNFGAVRVLKDLSLEIGAGEFFSLLGPSGCGKSTLLRIIAGLETADSGSVSLGGARIDNTPPQNRGIGMVFQQYALWPHLTIAQNVRFGLETQSLTNKERDERMLKALDRVQMSDLRERYPHQISGGQQQRVALARALALQPAVVLLDEPLSNLDARLRAEIRNELATLHTNLGTTMIYVTHDQEDALSLSSRLAIMNSGVIEQIGTPQEIYRNPASAFCARFIGDANLIPCRLVERVNSDIGRVIIDGAQPLSIEVRLNSLTKGDEVAGFICIRDTDLSFEALSESESLSGNRLRAKVLRSSYRGAKYDIDLVREDGSFLRATSLLREDLHRLSPGLDVAVSWPPRDGVFIKER